MVRFNSAGRIQPTEYRHLLQPGQCVLCNRIGRRSEEIFANLGVELEFYGIVYLCQDCCYEVVSFMEAVPNYEVQSIRNDMLELEQVNADIMEQNSYLRSLLDVRIESSGRGESHGDGAVGSFVLKNDRSPAESYKIIDGNKSEPSESGQG